MVLIGLYFLKCTKFDQLILRKIIKIDATRCQILRLKCTKFDFGWGSAPDRAGGAYSAPPDPLAGLRGPTSKGMGQGKGGEGRGREETGGKGRGGKRRGREGKGGEGCPPDFAPHPKPPSAAYEMKQCEGGVVCGSLPTVAV